MVDYSRPRVEYQKIVQKSIFWNFFFGFFYRSRGSREPSGRVQNRSRSWKTSKKWKFSKFYENYNCPPRHQIIIIIFRRAIITITMAGGHQKDEFYLYIGRLRHGPNSKTSIKNRKSCNLFLSNTQSTWPFPRQVGDSRDQLGPCGAPALG